MTAGPPSKNFNSRQASGKGSGGAGGGGIGGEGVEYGGGDGGGLGGSGGELGDVGGSGGWGTPIAWSGWSADRSQDSGAVSVQVTGDPVSTIRSYIAHVLIVGRSSSA